MALSVHMCTLLWVTTGTPSFGEIMAAIPPSENRRQPQWLFSMETGFSTLFCFTGNK